MVNNPKGLIDDFLRAVARPVTVEHEAQFAPHRGHSLGGGLCAVYVFSLSHRYGSSSPAGPDRVLKVGKAGANCNARFQSQHYNPGSAPSTLSGKLISTPVMWIYLGINTIDRAGVRPWMENNLDRDNFYLNVADADLLGTLETYIKGRFGPVFEG